MKTIKIKVNAGSKNLNNPERFFRDMPELRKHFKFVASDDPDFIISFSKKGPPKGNCVKIAYAREYMQTDMSQYDWGLGWQYEDQIKSDRYIRFPNYTFLGAGTNLIKRGDYNPEKILAQKTKFCAFICWHSVPLRVKFFKYLNRYKKVHSPGPCCNNVPPIGEHKTPLESRLSKDFYKEKIEYLKQFKFVIAFENIFAVGYTSERIYNAMLANSIPIYWGNPQVFRDFNTNSFINAHDRKFASHREMFEHLMRRIKRLDQDDGLYLKMLRQPWYPNNTVTKYADQERVFRFFSRIFNSR